MAASTELWKYFKRAEMAGYLGKKEDGKDETPEVLPEDIELELPEWLTKTPSGRFVDKLFVRILKKHKACGELLVTFYDMCAAAPSVSLHSIRLGLLSRSSQVRR